MPQRGDKSRLRLPGAITRGWRHETLAEPDWVPSEAAVCTTEEKAVEGKRRHFFVSFFFFQNASGSLVLRSGLVV